jgi:hypothetical protein
MVNFKTFANRFAAFLFGLRPRVKYLMEELGIPLFFDKSVDDISNSNIARFNFVIILQ